MPEQTTWQAKLIVGGRLELMTGIHIGAARAGMRIGEVDSPVIRDPLTDQPYIPGSSLKGKLRSLVEIAYGLEPNRSGGSGTSRHECDSREEALGCRCCRLFGSTGGKGGTNHPARLLVRDLHLTDESVNKLENIDTGLHYTEWKFENALDRITAAANPRQLERVPKGASFSFEFVLADCGDSLREDLETLTFAMQTLEDDYLGGHGSRGYGKVAFRDIGLRRKSVADYEKGEIVEEKSASYIADIVKLAG